MNFADVLDIGDARQPHTEAICVDDRELDYATLRERALKVTGLLQAQGVARGDRVGVVMYNALEFAEIAFGIMGAGAVLVPVNTRLAAAEMTYVLDHAEVTLLFHGPEFEPMIEQIRPDLGRVRGTYVVGSTYDEALQSATAAAGWEDMDGDDDCMVVYTSGTTGNPKGAVRSHASGMWGASNFTTTFGHFPYGDDRFMYAIPLASIGFLNVFCACLFAGLPVELMYGFDPGKALELIERKGVTHTYFVPSMWRMCLHADPDGERDTSALQVGIWGGEPLDAALREAIIERYGPVLLGAFGMTEGSLLTARIGDDATRPCTVGRAAGYNQFRIVDDEGAEVARGTVGEIINKSPTTLTRYLKNEEATAEVLRDGWYFTGDLGAMDDEGYVTVVDRKKEMLISGGQNVYPAEIEQALKKHPGVAAAAVIGVKDDQWGEVGMAFVVAAGDPPAEEALLEHARELLARYKVPKHWRFVSELPTNANGKVRKHELRSWA